MRRLDRSFLESPIGQVLGGWPASHVRFLILGEEIGQFLISGRLICLFGVFGLKAQVTGENLTSPGAGSDISGRWGWMRMSWPVGYSSGCAFSIFEMSCFRNGRVDFGDGRGDRTSMVTVGKLSLLMVSIDFSPR